MTPPADPSSAPQQRNMPCSDGEALRKERDALATDLRRARAALTRLGVDPALAERTSGLLERLRFPRTPVHHNGADYASPGSLGAGTRLALRLAEGVSSTAVFKKCA